MPIHLETSRLLLRRWCPADRAPFAALNADPLVMRYFPAPLTQAESDALADRIQSHFDQHGFGLWAVERKNLCPFLGFVGLAIPRFEAPFTPCVEVGWRLARDHWGQGYAPEAARAALDWGFQHLKIPEIVSFTAHQNLPSRRVMEKLGMTHHPHDDFDHPLLPINHPLRPHVLYRLSA